MTNTPPLHHRGTAMVERVRVTVEYVMGAAAATTVADAVTHALAPRHALDPEGPVYLHPARTVLILVADCELYDVDALVAGALLETHHLELAADPAQASDRAAAILAATPRPELPEPREHPERADRRERLVSVDHDELRERLVSADPDARLVALAERLDHARHLRQYPTSEWLPMYLGIRDAYLPVAEWTHALLGARFRRWATAFARRLPAS